MGHNPSDARTGGKPFAAKKIEEKRTPEEILKGIRGNLAAHLSVTPNDIAFLLAQYDDQKSAVGLLVFTATELRTQITDLQAKVEELRSVYEQENRSTTVTFEQVATPQTDFAGSRSTQDPVPSVEVHAFLDPSIGRVTYTDHGGEA